MGNVITITEERLRQILTDFELQISDHDRGDDYPHWLEDSEVDAIVETIKEG